MRSRALCIFPIAVTALLVAAYIVGGRPRPVYQSGGSIVALQADDQGLAWLEADESGPASGGNVFALGRGDRSPRRIYSQGQARRFALSGDRVLVLESDGQGGSLLSVPRSGGQPTTLEEGLLQPGGLLAEDGSAYWTETSPAAAPHVWHMPTLLSRTVIRSRPIQSQGAERAVAAVEAQSGDFRGALLGLHDGRLYWLDVSGATGYDSWSTIRSALATGGLVQTVAREKGIRTALLDAGVLCWTAPSEDAGDPSVLSCIRRSSPPEVSPVTLTDWVMTGGSFYRFRGQLHYAAVDGVWVVPEALGKPRQLGRRVFGPGLAVGWKGAIYEVAFTPAGHVLRCRPITLGARLRAAARIP